MIYAGGEEEGMNPNLDAASDVLCAEREKSKFITILPSIKCEADVSPYTIFLPCVLRLLYMMQIILLLFSTEQIHDMLSFTQNPAQQYLRQKIVFSQALITIWLLSFLCILNIHWWESQSVGKRDICRNT